MKIQNIKISSFRGIPDHFERDLNCNSLVITGDNGTGKSGLIDAVDFLLTGKVKRLSGEGTKDMSQEKYGHHIDKTKEDAKVKAEIKFKGKNLTVERLLKSPKKLKILKGDNEIFNNLKTFLETGQFSLSRRELLKFIICTDQDRSKAIQELLDISEIEKVRKSIDQSYKKSKAEKDDLKNSIEKGIFEIQQKLNLESSAQKNEVREKINEYRKKLKTEEITQWNQDTDILKGINFKKISSNDIMTKTSFEQKIKFLTQPNESIKKEKVMLIETINKILKIESFKELTKTNDLVEIGMKLLTDNTCPLCDTDWKEKNLFDYLRSKLEKAKNAIQLKDDFQNHSNTIQQYLTEYLSHLENLLQNIQKPAYKGLKKELEISVNFVKSRINLYKDISKRDEILKEIEKESNIIDLPNWSSLRKEAKACLDDLPKESEQEKIYQNLTYIRDRRNDIQKSKVKLKNNNFDLVEKIKGHFENNTDSFFKNLYKDIESDFINYYKYLNEDEESFSANMNQKEGSVDLKVDFYKRGEHPPHALHSEGHQDSMGICLFLALMRKIKGDDFSIALLDDVMMSVDIGHRRKLAQLLKEKFPETQFLITTHDSIWARELKNLKVVNEDNVLKFRNWSPDTGPSYQIDDPWSQCEEYAEKGEVKLSAKILREALEGEFQDICSNLKTHVPFKKEGNWSLGELLDSSLKAFKDNLKKAKKAAESNNESNLKKIKDIENNFNQAKKEANTDQWTLNPMNHYNDWAKFSKDELKSLIGSMRKLHKAFFFDDEPFIISFHKHKPIALTTVSSKISFPLKS